MAMRRVERIAFARRTKAKLGRIQSTFCSIGITGGIGDKFMSELLFRSAGKANTVDMENRIAKFSFASTSPVMRFFGKEILSHEDGAMMRERLHSGAVPFLIGHDSSRQVGKIIDHHQSSKQSFATAKLSRSAEGDDILRDMVDGIRTEISVGYRVIKFQRTYKADPEKEGDIDEFTALKWEPVEISSVSIPADITVGIGRSEDFDCSYRDTEFFDENGKPLQLRIPSNESATRQLQPCKIDADSIINEVLADHIKRQVLNDYITKSDLQKACEAKGITKEIIEKAFTRVRFYNESPELALLTVLAEDK